MADFSEQQDTIKVKVFANLRKLAPAESFFPREDAIDIGSVMDALSIPRRKVTVIFLNGRHAEEDDTVQPGDTLSLFPPVGGG